MIQSPSTGCRFVVSPSQAALHQSMGCLGQMQMTECVPGGQYFACMLDVYIMLTLWRRVGGSGSGLPWARRDCNTSCAIVAQGFPCTCCLPTRAP
jgi:hypothetical protein